MATATLSGPKKLPTTDDGEYLIIENVPYFDEHDEVDAEGKPVKYDRRTLEGIVNTLNKRISERGMYVPIVDGHTPTKDERAQGAADPDILGYAGPFRLSQIGTDDPRWCIRGTERVLKNMVDRHRANPRRSVEMWRDVKNTARSYFDPIAALGAETPRRDLGLVLYSRKESGRAYQLQRYEMGTATVPGGANVFTPDDGRSDNPKKNERSERGPVGTLSEDDIAQIVEALTPVVKTQIAEAVEGFNKAPTLEPTAMPNGADPNMPPADTDNPVDQPAADHYGKMCQYAADDDMEGGKAYLDSLDDAGKKEVKDRYEKEEDETKKESLAKLFAGTSDDGEPEDKPVNSPAEKMPDQNAKAGEAERYRKENQMIQEKYAKLEKAHNELAAKFAAQEREGIVRERFSKIETQRAGGLAIPDTDEFSKEIRAMTDEQFSVWEKYAMPRYDRVPLGTLPGTYDLRNRHPVAAEAEKTKVSAEMSEEAVKYAQEQLDAGKPCTYESALRYVQEKHAK